MQISIIFEIIISIFVISFCCLLLAFSFDIFMENLERKNEYDKKRIAIKEKMILLEERIKCIEEVRARTAEREK